MHLWLERFQDVWPYIVLITMSFITEELAPLGGGFAAHEGHLNIAWVALSCGIGTWGADLGLYYLGRWRGAWARRRWPSVGRAFTRVLMGVRKRPWRSSIAVRYAYGLRLTLPIACGVAHVPLAEYIAGSAISAATWASMFTVIGWGFGRTALIVIRHAHHYEDVIALAAAGLLGLIVLLYVRRTSADDGEEDHEARAFEQHLDRLSGAQPRVTEEKKD